MRPTDDERDDELQDDELKVVALFSALGLAVSAAVISMLPEEAMSWAIAHLMLHLELMPAH